MEIVMSGVTWVLLSCVHGRISEFGDYDIFAWIEQDEFWMMSHHLFFDWKIDVFFFDYFMVTDVIWTWKYFLQSWEDALWDWISVQCSDVSGWDAMSKGGMEIVHPIGEGDKRHAIPHCGSDMSHRGTVFCTEDWQTTFYLLLKRSVQLTCCLVTVFYWTLSLQPFATLRSQLSMLTWYVVYWSVLHLILDSEWIWYSLLLELKTTTLVRHCDLYCAFDIELIWKYLMERTY